MPASSMVPAFPMLLRPSGAILYRLRMKSDTEWQTDGRISAVAVFAASHAGFQGHFPGRPILPGFLHIQLVLDILRIFEPQAELTAILSAKFHYPILPGAEIQIDHCRQLYNQAIAKLQIGEELASSVEFQFYTGSAPVPAAVVLQTS